MKKTISPFTNESESLGIADLTIENRTDRISIYGSIDLHLVRNPGMVPNETICGVRRFHRVVFQRCVRCPPILHESFKKLE